MEQIPSFLMEMGLPGLVILALGWFAWQRDKKCMELQDGRVDDTKEQLRETTGAINDNTRALDTLTQIIRDTNRVS